MTQEVLAPSISPQATWHRSFSRWLSTNNVLASFNLLPNILLSFLLYWISGDYRFVLIVIMLRIGYVRRNLSVLPPQHGRKNTEKEKKPQKCKNNLRWRHSPLRIQDFLKNIRRAQTAHPSGCAHALICWRALSISVDPWVLRRVVVRYKLSFFMEYDTFLRVTALSIRCFLFVACLGLSWKVCSNNPNAFIPPRGSLFNSGGTPDHVEMIRPIL